MTSPQSVRSVGSWESKVKKMHSRRDDRRLLSYDTIDIKTKKQ